MSDSQKDLNTWKSPEEWKRLYPTHRFEIANLGQWDEDSFPVKPVEALAIIIDNEGIVFDTFRFNIVGCTPRWVAEFVVNAAFDSVEFPVDDNTLQGWYD